MPSCSTSDRLAWGHRRRRCPKQLPRGPTVRPGTGTHVRVAFEQSAAGAAPTAADDRRSFEGGRITFWRELEQPWLAAEPVAGRAAFFSSGWENAHRVSPVTSGKRWALNLFLTAAAPPPPPAVQFVDECVEPGSLEAWEACERRWSHWLG